MPVNPPAASASPTTAGSQKRLKIVLRPDGGLVEITLGEYERDFRLSDFAAII
jgi:hypothetical protein